MPARGAPSSSEQDGRPVHQVARTLLPISTPREIEIGRGVAATIAGRYLIMDDTALTRYVSLVGLAVAGEDPRADIAYRFAGLETPTVNAFAAPGSYVFITRAALNLIANESVLAGVLGHEVGHVNRRHGSSSPNPGLPHPRSKAATGPPFAVPDLPPVSDPARSAPLPAPHPPESPGLGSP